MIIYILDAQTVVQSQIGFFEILIMAAFLAAIVLVIIKISNNHSKKQIGTTYLRQPEPEMNPINVQYKRSETITMNETKTCPYCGEEILAMAKKCKHCGEWLEEDTPGAPSGSQTAQTAASAPVTVMTRPSEQSVSQPIVINNTVTQRSNGIGTAGFIFSLIGWIPVVGWLFWFLGALFSFIGLFKSPRGLAIAGFIISFIDIIILVSAIGVISSIF